MDIEMQLAAGDGIAGLVTVGFPGRYDGIVINARILDSSEHIRYTSCNGGKISQVARLFVARDHMPDGRVEFAAVPDSEPGCPLEVKFRASIIEQHKEIASDVKFLTYGQKI